MKLERHPNFKKAYKKHIAGKKKLVIKTEERLLLFQNDPTNPVLQDHQLKGAKNKFRAISITGNIRIVYLQVSKDHVILLDIGTHNQVY